MLNHPTMYRMTPNIKNTLVQNINSAEVKKLWYVGLLSVNPLLAGMIFKIFNNWKGYRH